MSINYTALCAVLAAAAVGGSPAVAQTQRGPWAEMQAVSVHAGIGMENGEGRLHLPNLGTNCEYPFTVQGFAIGPQAGVSRIAASGPVMNLTKVSDFGGEYSTAHGEATPLGGGGGFAMKNHANNVTIDLKGNTQGVALGFSTEGLSINLPVAYNNAPHAYVLEFGFDKSWVNRDGREALDQVIASWKCRFANVWLYGHTDTVGKEDANLQLSQERAEAVRTYLIGAGMAPDRIRIVAKGETNPRVPTADNVRLRTNRAVVVMVQD